ncbi:MAG: glutamate 5-kinase [Candidatus Methanoplasma sp.]|jgi:glutamate 5-kinase|nr:glutamate 5-kinase [Candidatus Methanoplasma sp.]
MSDKMDRKELLGDVERVVIKVGTSTITKGGNTVSKDMMDSIARQVRELKDQGREVLIVTSGAIGIGLKAMDVNPNPNDIPIRQAASSVGQSILMQKWNESFHNHGILAAQILLTMDIYSDRESVLNLNNTIDVLLRNGVVPIFNENDAVSIKEIGHVFGDNDTLSAVIASRVDADILIILSDVDGLYDKNPNVHKDAKFIAVVEDISPEIENMAGGSVSGQGVGGMKTKIAAAKICKDAGCRMVIASNAVDDAVSRIADGENIGTMFVSDTHISKKRRWMKSAKPQGSIAVDEGAVKAVRNHLSLLPVGIIGVSGYFEEGDVVDIIHGDAVIAKGMSNYDSEDTSKIQGLHSSRIREVLGKGKHDDVVLSENMVIM